MITGTLPSKQKEPNSSRKVRIHHICFIQVLQHRDDDNPEVQSSTKSWVLRHLFVFFHGSHQKVWQTCELYIWNLLLLNIFCLNTLVDNWGPTYRWKFSLWIYVDGNLPAMKRNNISTDTSCKIFGSRLNSVTAFMLKRKGYRRSLIMVD